MKSTVKQFANKQELLEFLDEDRYYLLFTGVRDKDVLTLAANGITIDSRNIPSFNYAEQEDRQTFLIKLLINVKVRSLTTQTEFRICLSDELSRLLGLEKVEMVRGILAEFFVPAK